MADYQAGKRYAQAVFPIAVLNDTIPRWRSELEDIASVLAESEMAGMFDDERVPVAQRQALVDRVLDVSPIAGNLAKLLISKGRSRDARAVADAFNRMADEREGVVYADVTTAVPLSDAEVQSVAEKLSQSMNKRVIVRPSVDPAITGGMIARIGDRVIDGSIRARLKELRKELVSAR
jgi:F-type H+-transporting ATPase subunit delta